MDVPLLFISETKADFLLRKGGVPNGIYKIMSKISKKGKPWSREINLKIGVHSNMVNDKITSENVLGFVEGTDKKEEVVIVTAHYDHIGKHDGHIFNGADDDGSGTTALLMMAEAFSKAKSEGFGPRRSILFMPVSAEEKGLLGSRYYSENPIIPLENTVADLNIDMIGRIDEVHHDREGIPNPNYVYIIGSDFFKFGFT
jgi:Zn-dependent M28 family amino/carboxypeptidase